VLAEVQARRRLAAWLDLSGMGTALTLVDVVLSIVSVASYIISTYHVGGRVRCPSHDTELDAHCSSSKHMYRGHLVRSNRAGYKSSTTCSQCKPAITSGVCSALHVSRNR
jgi:hypothetical protein